MFSAKKAIERDNVLFINKQNTITQYYKM